MNALEYSMEKTGAIYKSLIHSNEIRAKTAHALDEALKQLKANVEASIK